MIRPFNNRVPNIADSAFIEETAVIIGDVGIGEHSSIWFYAVVRGDIHHIRIGRRSNIQDHSVLHVRDSEGAVLVGEDVTVGHRAVLHGCTIADRVLIGMGAVVLDDAIVSEGSIIGAGAVVPPRIVVPPRSLVVGTPGKVKRAVRQEELDWIQRLAEHYVEYARRYRIEDSARKARDGRTLP
jgi:gamma-carbonic anhydrase